MTMDKNLVFASALAVDNGIATVLEGDVIDLDTGGRQLYSNANLKWVIEVTKAFTSGGASTVAFSLVSDEAAAITVNGTETVHVKTGAFSLTELVVGLKLILPIPAGAPSMERYLGIHVVTAVAATTAGKISSYLVMDAQDWTSYPDASN